MACSHMLFLHVYKKYITYLLRWFHSENVVDYHDEQETIFNID